MNLSIDPTKGGMYSLDEDHVHGMVTRAVHAVGMFKRRVEQAVEQTQPYPLHRWTCALILLLTFVLRMLLLQGWYAVAYALGIYLLNGLLAFLSPKFDFLDDVDNESDITSPGPALPTKSDEEFRPFIRRLPEYMFWTATCRAIIISIFCTFFSVFDVPVFWPILLIYFLVLFALTMRKQIKHMIKHNYIPFDIGKKTYG